MIYQVEKIVADARVALGARPVAQQSWLQDCECQTLGLDQAIRQRIEPVVDQTHLEAPLHWLEEGHAFADSICWEAPCRAGIIESYSGWTFLPEDFLRLIAFEMDDWSQPVTEALVPGCADYALQRSLFPGLRGTPQWPACAIVCRQEGKALEFYSCKTNRAMPVRALYMPRAKIVGGGVDIAKACYPTVIQNLKNQIENTYANQ